MFIVPILFSAATTMVAFYSPFFLIPAGMSNLEAICLQILGTIGGAVATYGLCRAAMRG